MEWAGSRWLFFWRFLFFDLGRRLLPGWSGVRDARLRCHLGTGLLVRALGLHQAMGGVVASLFRQVELFLLDGQVHSGRSSLLC